MGTTGQVRISLAGCFTASDDKYISEKVYRELNDGKVRFVLIGRGRSGFPVVLPARGFRGHMLHSRRSYDCDILICTPRFL